MISLESEIPLFLKFVGPAGCLRLMERIAIVEGFSFRNPEAGAGGSSIVEDLLFMQWQGSDDARFRDFLLHELQQTTKFRFEATADDVASKEDESGDGVDRLMLEKCLQAGEKVLPVPEMIIVAIGIEGSGNLLGPIDAQKVSEILIKHGVIKRGMIMDQLGKMARKIKDPLVSRISTSTAAEPVYQMTPRGIDKLRDIEKFILRLQT